MSNWRINTQAFTPADQADVGFALDAAVEAYDAEHPGENTEQIARARDVAEAEASAMIGPGGGMQILMAGFTTDGSSSVSVTVQPATVTNPDAVAAQLRARAAAQPQGEPMEAANPNAESDNAPDAPDPEPVEQPAKKTTSSRSTSKRSGSKSTGKASTTGV